MDHWSRIFFHSHCWRPRKICLNFLWIWKGKKYTQWGTVSVLLECHRDQRQIGAECCSYNKRKNRNEKKLLLIKGCKSTVWIICSSREKIPNSDTLLCLVRANWVSQGLCKGRRGRKEICRNYDRTQRDESQTKAGTAVTTTDSCIVSWLNVRK